MTVEAVLENVSADAWSDAFEEGRTSTPKLADAFSNVDFAGIAMDIKHAGGAEDVPMVSLKFLDYLGLLGSTKVPVGKELQQSGPITSAIRAFLLGCRAEGIDVAWVDPDHTEPSFATPKPKLMTKKRGKAPSKTTHGKQNYLDVLVEACGHLGVVPRMNVATLELAFAGTMYEGRDRGGESKATLLLGGVIEDWDAEHTLIGPKLDPTKPQVLLYETVGDKLQLVAAEWFVPTDLAKEAPTIFGQKLQGPMEGHEPVIPAALHHWDLHVWLWKANPAGLFSSTNPALKCPKTGYSFDEMPPKIVKP